MSVLADGQIKSTFDNKKEDVDASEMTTCVNERGDGDVKSLADTETNM